MQEVFAGSIPVASTSFFQQFLASWRLTGFTLGGLVAGEGAFIVTTNPPPYHDGSPRKRFVFQVAMATRDRPLLVALQRFLGFGSITDGPARRAHWQPISKLTLSSRRAHNAATIPFATQFLLACAKRDQFERWRSEFESYQVARPTRWGLGPSSCSVPECGRPVRSRGLCRSHYYLATGY